MELYDGDGICLVYGVMQFVAAAVGMQPERWRRLIVQNSEVTDSQLAIASVQRTRVFVKTENSTWRRRGILKPVV